MRLLRYRDNGEISLTKDLLGNDEIPPYAILSHTWGTEEVTYDDIVNQTGREKVGQKKIQFCMKQAQHDGLRYSWVDTCCINKADTTELQHAINSMFRWYQDAVVCYAFLPDVSTAKRKPDSEFFQTSWEPAFRISRWFTRGWTLQELLAPRHVKFYSREKELLGDVEGLKDLIHSITKLPLAALTGASLHNFGVEDRLDWTRYRTTTREEDKAYSLLGIFGIFMPLLYGEGQKNAFRRLRKEIRERRYASQAFLRLSEPDLECLRSLSYPEQEHRRNDIHTAIETCTWLRQHSQYKTWMTSSQGLFWVKGSPGSGKSVLMKYAFQSMVAQKHGEIVVSHFFHGHGSELQRTPIGAYRALLNSLLGHFPSCLAKLTEIFEDREKRFGGYVAGRWVWNCQELQESLAYVLLEHTQSQQTTVFIDALDECGEGPARSLLTFFCDLSRRAERREAKVRICLSSRHYPIIGLDDFPTVSLEEQNSEDIQWYVNDRLQDIRPSKQRQRIQEEILSKAQGGFQWVFLVTQTLLTRALTGRNLLGHIQACPRTLSEMYAALLDTGTEEDKLQTTKLFQWILFAKRPLSAQELREALATDARMNCSSVADLRSHGNWSETLDDFERYINHISKGLVAFKGRDIWEQWEDSDREAQLIHQSVADFLLERCTRDTRYGSISLGHFQISRSCLRYLTLPEVLEERWLPRDALSSRFPLAPYAVRYVFDHISGAEAAGVDQSDLTSAIYWSSRPSDTARQLDGLWATLNPSRIGTPVGWPFIGTSEIHVLAALGLKGQLLAILKGEKRLLDEQERSGNRLIHVALLAGHSDVALLILQHCYKSVKQRRDRDSRSNGTELPTPTTGLILDLDAQDGEGDTLLDTAVALKEYTIVKELITAGADLRCMSQPHLLVRHAIGNHDAGLLAKLIAGNIDLAGAVYFAVESDTSAQIISDLLRAGGDHGRLDSRGDRSHVDGDDSSSDNEAIEESALHLACRLVLPKTVDILLSYGAPATALDSSEQCPLHVAVNLAVVGKLADRIRIVQSLLRYAPTAIELEDDEANTPLNMAFEQRNHTLIEIFLEHGQFSRPSVCLTGVFLDYAGRASLWHDIGLQDPTKAIKLLPSVDRFNLNASNDRDQTVFWLAAAYGLAPLVERLIEVVSVGINRQDHNLTSPLLAAIKAGHVEVTRSLLSAPLIDVNARDKKGVSPILAASRAADTTILKMLLSKEHINANVTDKKGIPVILAAALAGSAPVVIELVNRDEINANDKAIASLLLTFDEETGGFDAQSLSQYGQVMLKLAIKFWDGTRIQLLLEHMQTIRDSMKKQGWTPPKIAVSTRDPSIIQMLINADMLAADATPLWLAAEEADKSTFREMLRIHAGNLDAEDAQGRSLLSWAAEQGDADVVALLLGTGRVDAHHVDSAGLTPAQKASRNGHIIVASKLVAHIADKQRLATRRLPPPPGQEES